MSTSKFKTISVKNEWQKLLDDVEQYDFYHTYDYHHLSKAKGDIPILIKYEEDGVIIGLPFLMRRIFDTEYYDITSVYGYAGTLHKNVDENYDNTKFIAQLIHYFNENKIVSVFSRLNPFIPFQETAIAKIGKISTLSKIVNIDITKNIDEQRTLFSKTTKRYINKARKLCLVKSGGTMEDMQTFRDLYYENMDRVQAKKSYYFNEAYFNSFINSSDFETDVLFAILKETNEIISAAMMVKTNNIIQYHISGTRNDYLNLTPIRLLIDEMRIKGTEHNYTYFNLGGGLGSSEDSLFNFKASFSKDFKDFKVWKHIVNQSVYDELSSQYANKSNDQSFFPLYRNSKL
ncbi:peptidoglycan bridge formation glycyltransferase FemA/FemB family protein [Aquimarina agarivorans]|uniref:peptidoglycan bridge formation glycyltransferase FemA/FemB family protein n=1 Tax=Aquimarina agarivorans TaxID=980584 RepID=UPI000248E813|nr:peptidoglycan bridge formation glycyltransferase FemA/FemB family protein [Aquimarina agarivorans]